jgi:phage terminase large subunit GpA-like protein
MPLLFQPSPPPCAKCGTTTVLTPAFEEGQRVFVVRCPACGRAGTYTLDYSALASGEPDHGAASVGGLGVTVRCSGIYFCTYLL